MTQGLANVLFDQLTARGDTPPEVQDLVRRSLGVQAPLSWVCTEAFHATVEDGVSRQVRLAVLTRTRLLISAWYEVRNDVKGDDDTDAQFEKLMRGQGFGDVPDSSPAGGAHLIVYSRVVPLTQVVDVQTTLGYGSVNAGGGRELASARVLVLSPTLATFEAEPIFCEDEECEGAHGWAGTAMQDGLQLAMSTEDRTPAELERLLHFATELGRLLGADGSTVA